MTKRLNIRRFIFYILIPILPLIVFWFIPMAISVWISLTDWDYISPTYNYVQLGNYQDIFQSKDFWATVRNTIFFTVGTILPTLIFGFILAYLLSTGIKYKNVFRTLLFCPWVTPMVAVSIVWSWMFRADVGLINQVLGMFGIQGPNWLSNSSYAMWAVIIVTVWKNIGWAMIFYSDALSKIPKELYDVGRIEGMNVFQKISMISIPMVKKTTFFLVMISMINAIQAYDQISVLTQGGPSGSTRTLLYLFYQTAFEMFKMGKASAISTIILVITAVIALVLSIRQKKMEG